MQTASINLPLAVNIDAELNYWRSLHAEGRLGNHAFSDYSQLLKLGYHIYLAYPHASPIQRYRVLQDSYHQHRSAWSIPWHEARWVVRSAWQRMAQSARPH